MRDPYEVLGVPKSASAAAIKSAFRKLAKKLHPDANKNDPKAAARFAELNAAYEIVGDEDKRKAFDRGEIDAEGKPRFQGFEGFGAAAGRRRRRPRRQFRDLHLGPGGLPARAAARGGGGGGGGFEDILQGHVRRRGAPARRRGARQFEPEDFGAPAPGRDVTATVTITLRGGRQGRHAPRPPADRQGGRGQDSGRPRRRPADPAEGAGPAGPGGAAGDVLITVSIAPHPLFERDGADLRLELPVTLYEAVLGAKVRVPTLDGAVELAIPAGTSSGRTFRLKGKGLPGKGGAGDLLATVRIVLPAHADPELEELMQQVARGQALRSAQGSGLISVT